jgi:hypothetical protein
VKTVEQPIWLIRAGRRPVDGLAAEVLRCEGYPWLEERPADGLAGIPPDVRAVVVAGEELTASQAAVLARAVTSGTPLLALSPQTMLAMECSVTVGETITDAHVLVEDVPGWQHGALPLLCPGATARPLSGGHTLAVLQESEGQAAGSALAEARLGQGRAWLLGFDLAAVIAALRHGSGELDERGSGDMGPLVGPRHLFGFYELSEKVPRRYPVADLLQDMVRLVLEQALVGSALPRLWHFPEARRRCGLSSPTAAASRGWRPSWRWPNAPGQL